MLDDQKVADDAIVVFATDNGPLKQTSFKFWRRHAEEYGQTQSEMQELRRKRSSEERR